MMNRLLKLKIPLFLSLTGISLSGWAEEQVSTLDVWTKSGERITYYLNEHPVAAYSGNDLVLKTDELTVSYPLTKLHKFTFGSESTSVETEQVSTLDVWTKSGERITYFLSEHPVAAYSGSDLVLKTDGQTVSYPLIELHKFTFGSEATSVGTMYLPDGRVQMQQGMLCLSGFRAGEMVLQHWRAECAECNSRLRR